MKYSRHNKILEIISQYDIDTQDELIIRLRQAGFEVTQATVSRDIRDLKLVKIAIDGHRYKYAVSTHDEMKISSKYRNIIHEMVTNVDFANNFVVLRTYSGMASAVAAAVDGMGWSEIVGTLAGDDTVFVILRDNDSALEFVNKVRDICRSVN